jgi:Flp pilus assembly protein TadD
VYKDRVMRRAPTAVACLASALLAAGAGCRAFEGARLTRSGMQALERGEPLRAVADLEGAAVRVPNDSEVHNRLGVAYAAAGRQGEAIREFESAVALDCGNEVAARNLERARAEASAAP